MQLLDGEKKFLERRRRLVRSWRYVGTSLLLLVAIMGCWLFIQNPLLANPVFVVSALNRGEIEQETIELMAVMLPIAVIAVMVVCMAFMMLMFVAFANEAKYLAIIAREAENGGETPDHSPQSRRS